jgi:hypothetical protein
MVVKKDLWIIVVSSVALFLLLNLITSYYFELPVSYALLVGKSSFGTINLFIQGQNGTIFIDSPDNRSEGYGPYTVAAFADLELDLNVSAGFNATAWNYSLYDARHDVYVYEDQAFDPNATISPVRWSNRLDVVAVGNESELATASVSFFISVLNSYPIIGDIDDPIQVCENTDLNYLFNATDVDEDELIHSIYLPNNIFFLTGAGSFNESVTTYSLFTSTVAGLTHNDVGNHSRNITVNDDYSDECCTDTAEVTIEVIEVNDEPVAENISTQTVYFNGTGKSLEYQWGVTDEEDGGSLDGNLTFNITGNFDLFIINETGFMDYTPNATHEGTYEITVCAIDNALSSIHQNISICTGQQATSNYVCEDFNLVVTDVNRAPNITGYSPENLSFSVRGNTPTRFDVNATDPDGVNPDIIWYVEGVESQRTENDGSSTFWHTFDCAFSGTRTVLVNATDGDMEDTVSWTVEVLYEDCPPGGPQDPPPSGGGGGGGGAGDGSSCYENWFCQGWGVCLNVEDAFGIGALNLGDYLHLKEVCLQNQYLGTSCGFQEELCSDLKSCNNTIPIVAIPSEKRSCYYTADPSCYDEILNCHGGGCEVLIDCGGPCQACPTCTDGIRNQGESGIDCGGPCPSSCQYEEPKMKLNFFWMWLLLLLLIILLFIIYKVLKIFGYLPIDEKKEKKFERRARRKLESRVRKTREPSKKR